MTTRRFTAQFDAVGSWWTDTINDIEMWWYANVTTTMLIVSAAFLVLATALLHTTLQLRKLKRIIAPPPISQATRRRWQFGTSYGFATEASQKMNEPLKGAVLDEQTIRESFGTDTKRREEFEL